jgi:hypothetical protein
MRLFGKHETKDDAPILIAVDQLKEHPRNYRQHPDDQLEHIAKSIETHGFYRNVVAARDLTILAGHGVVRAAKKLGIAEVPTVRLDLDPMEPRALKLLAGDNEMGNLALVDDRALTEMLKGIMIDDADGLLGTGFDEMQLAALTMVTRTAAEIGDKNEAAEWLGLPEYKPGDPPVTMAISFRNEEDRETFLKKMGISHNDVLHWKTKKTISTWWPPLEDADRSSVRFEETS